MTPALVRSTRPARALLALLAYAVAAGTPLAPLLTAATAAAQEVERDVVQRVDDLQDMGVAAVPVNDFVYRIQK